MKRNKPPRLANILLRMFLRREDYLEKTGDLEEVYSSLCGDKGKPIAIAWYWMQVLTAIPVIISNSFYWSMVMLKNYFKLSLRNMLKQKVYSLITITGLAVGLGLFLYILRFYSWRTEADAFIKDIDRIYNVVQVLKSPSEGDRHIEFVPYPLVTAIKDEIPEVEDAASFVQLGQTVLEYKDNKFFEDHIFYVSPSFLSFFSYNIIEGNPEIMLAKPNSIVVTKAMALKYFGNENPIEKTVTLANKVKLTVTGVVDDLNSYANTSSMNYGFLISMDVYKTLGNKPEDWNTSNYVGFIKLRNGIQSSQINEKLSGFADKYFQQTPESPKLIYIFPSRENEFGAPNISTYTGQGDLRSFIVVLVLGVLILLIVIINFVNLATSRSVDRIKEVGIRKTLGANRSQLIMQFLGETTLTTLLAIPFACVVYIFFGSWLNSQIGILGVKVSISFLSNGNMLTALIVVSLITGILSGLYPSFILSSLRPMNLLKTNSKKGKKGGKLRNILIVGQIVASLIFIVLSLSWSELSDHVYNSNLGYNRKNVVFIPVSQDTLNNYKLFQAELKNNPEFQSVAASNGTPGIWSPTALIIPEGKSANEAVRSYLYAISSDFMKTMEMQLISGRGFSEEYNDENSYIINQLTAKRFGWDNPVGKSIQVGDKKGVIIGLVKDYYFSHMSNPIRPALLYLGKNNLNKIFIKYSGKNDIASIKEKVKGTWNKIYTDIPLEITSLESYFQDINLGNTYIPARFTKILGGAAMFFSCIGLLAMISHSARKKKKEIAIRKVHGASITNIVILLGREFVIIILLASFIGLPIAFLLTDQMFSMFPIRNSIGIGVLLLTLLLLVSISSLFIIKEILKAAKQAPVETLKCE